MPDPAPLVSRSLRPAAGPTRWVALALLSAANLLAAAPSPVVAQTIEGAPALSGKSVQFPAATATAAALPMRIEQALHAPDNDGAAGSSTDAAVVRLFYYGRGYRPAWTEKARAKELIMAVEASRQHGLVPADFAIDALRKAAAGGDNDADAIVRRELLFTTALAGLARQLHYGKVDPRSLYSIWDFSPIPGVRERAIALSPLLEADSLSTALAALAPQDEAYRALQKALSRVAALAASGGWPQVPAGATLHPGERDARVQALRARLLAEGWIAATDISAADSKSTRYDAALQAAMQRFQRAHGLTADGAVGQLTLAALNVSAAQRVAQIRVNLERMRWVARDMTATRLTVDLAGFNAELRLDGVLRWSSKVIVGRPTRETPVLLDHVQHLVLNPKWIVPPTVLREDVIPGVIRNAAYLNKHQMRVVDASGQTVAPAQIDWSGVSRTDFPYRIVQQSGADGALGQVKFSLSNGYSIYLHDTPTRSLFRKPARALSSGCVRLEKPRDLALLLLDDPQLWNDDALATAIASGQTKTLPVALNVPVMLLYLTATADAMGTISFRTDIYDRDGPVLARLDSSTRPRL